MPDRNPQQVPHVGVGAVVFHDGKILLVRRAQPPSEGLWAIPGGRVKLGETLQQAAEREVFEETGVVICAERPIFTFDTIDRDEQHAVRFHYVIVDFDAVYVSGEPHAGDDAEEARWISMDEAGKIPMSDKTIELLRGLRFLP